MFCKKCGAALTDDAKFCPSCGATVADESEFSGTADATNVTEPYPGAQPNPAQPDYSYAQQNNAQPNYGQPNYGYTQQNSAQPGYGQPNYAQQNAPSASYGAQQKPLYFDCGIQQRDIAVAIILSIVTCGIYNIYWFIKQVDDVNRAANDQNAFSGGVTFLLGMVTCGIYSLYWFYQAGKKMSYAQQVRNMPVKENLEILYLLLSLFGFGIVSMALIQNDLNKMATQNA